MKTKEIIPHYKRGLSSFRLYISMLLLLIFYGCSSETEFITTNSGLQYKIVKSGVGPKVINGQEVLIHETTKYMNDSLIYTSRNKTNPLKILVGSNQAIDGVDEGLQGMKKGEIRKLIVPPILSKRNGIVGFPHPDSTLLYDIELIDILEKSQLAPKIKEKETLKIDIDTENSAIRWEGFNKDHTNGHYGTVSFYSGEFFKEKNKIIGGEFVIDMNSIINIDGGYSESLVDHLKNADFFDTEKYPISKLSITNTKYIDDSTILIKADLTIKEVKQSIEFEAQVAYKDEKMIFTSKFSINRTRWGILYGSANILIYIGNNIISDEIQLEVTINTK